MSSIRSEFARAVRSNVNLRLRVNPSFSPRIAALKATSPLPTRRSSLLSSPQKSNHINGVANACSARHRVLTSPPAAVIGIKMAPIRKSSSRVEAFGKIDTMLALTPDEIRRLIEAPQSEEWQEKNAIDAEIAVRQHMGKRIFIPRISMSPSDDDLFPFRFKRKQFPIRLSFAMTINKAEGQTVPNVGVYLPEPVFSHGQLYVALSRGVSKQTTKILVKPCENVRSSKCVLTKNVVYHEVLRRQ